MLQLVSIAFMGCRLAATSLGFRNMLKYLCFLTLIYLTTSIVSNGQESIGLDPARYITVERARTLLKEKYNFESDITSVKIFDKTFYIIGCRKNFPPIDNDLIVLRKKGNAWEKISYLKDEQNVIEIELTKINNDIYLYFATKTADDDQISLLMVNIKNHKKWRTDFRGWPILPMQWEQPLGDIKKEKILYDYIKSRELYKKLNEEVKLSKKDMTLPYHYSSVWAKNNFRLYDSLNCAPQKRYRLFMPEYNYNLYEMFSALSIESAKENELYSIVSYFKGDLFGYNKKTKKYFIVWRPSELHAWVEKIEFVTDRIIRINDHYENEYEIDLENKTIMSLKPNPFFKPTASPDKSGQVRYGCLK